MASVLAATAVTAPSVWLFGPTAPTAAPPPADRSAWVADRLRPPDPTTATPAQISSYFAGLSPADATGLTIRFPRLVGNLDGAPVGLRYTANRLQRPAWSGRQILALDTRGDGQVAEVLGDLGTAARVTVLIPGVDDNLADFDSGHGGVLRRAPSWQARRLYEQARRLDPGTPVAVVAWLGYDPPEGVRRDALREDRAAEGAIRLIRFVDGLVLGRPGLRVTLIGHSYGSTVAGLAASRLSDQVTDIVALGSPGMGVGKRADLHTGARVWAGSAPDDWTRRVPGLRLFGVGHGILPVAPGFGALPLPCADVEGHDGYFVPGTSSLRAMAEIALGGESR
ncbi:alpha/beta hydrolase family protein [Actinoplanes sp. KI2]|uniref:alpha/beta hydrolase family protein n=1 Tax=Actinoplanes sp. KI2 TaxID=2983315 RepID=UPI0021D5FBB4|nr:alpha/beta hydrolase family protein [Actinoplanes sp. KI2]MCU7728840.1 alpha/beta hydrolase family protein [Actinoplanes sp. KI2]